MFLSTACFAHGRYEQNDAIRCISNLLAVGFRKLVVDLYWDATRQSWGFCPVAIPASTENLHTASVSLPLTTSDDGAPALAQINDSVFDSSATRSQGMKRRSYSRHADQPRFSSAFPSVKALPTALSSSIIATSSSFEKRSESYVCSPTLSISTLTELLLEYFQQSETTVGAHLIYVALNLRATAPSSPEIVNASPFNFPAASNSPGSYFQRSLFKYIYGPDQLLRDRQNLNTSWYGVPLTLQPDPAYYTTSVGSDYVHSTSDGWPSEGFVEVDRGRRLLLGWGSLDSRMQDYDVGPDANMIFPPGYIENFSELAATNSGSIVTGCHFNSQDTKLAVVNSSWSFSGQVADFDFPTTEAAPLEPLFNLLTNLSSCGISPMVNWTIFNSTASQNVSLYKDISQMATWPWASGEPLNDTSKETSNTGPSGLFLRCAFLDNSTDARWRVRDCSEHHYAACRINGEPYSWIISDSPATYNESSTICPPSSSFSAPRTGMENAYLYTRIRDLPNLQGGGVWVDFNSLDVSGCWVTGGPDTTCPYRESVIEARRNLLVPWISGGIVLTLAALTVFVKCNAQRRLSRRKTRRERGWDYEGSVPHLTDFEWTVLLLIAIFYRVPS